MAIATIHPATGPPVTSFEPRTSSQISRRIRLLNRRSCSVRRPAPSRPRTIDDRIHSANDCRFGWRASAWGKDRSEPERSMDKREVGMAFITRTETATPRNSLPRSQLVRSSEGTGNRWNQRIYDPQDGLGGGWAIRCCGKRALVVTWSDNLTMLRSAPPNTAICALFLVFRSFRRAHLCGLGG